MPDQDRLSHSLRQPRASWHQICPHVLDIRRHSLCRGLTLSIISRLLGALVASVARSLPEWFRGEPRLTWLQVLLLPYPSTSNKDPTAAHHIIEGTTHGIKLGSLTITAL